MKTAISRFFRNTAALWVMIGALVFGITAGAAWAGKTYHDGHGHGYHGYHDDDDGFRGWMRKLRGDDGDWSERMAGKIAKRLDLELDDNQLAELQTLLKESSNKRRALFETMHSDARAIVIQETISTEDAQKLLSLRRELREAMANNMAESLVAFHALLTPEQRAEVSEKAAFHVLHQRGKRGKGGHRLFHY